MKPIRASIELHSVLTKKLGFGWSRGYYKGFPQNHPLSVGLEFARHQEGWTVQVCTYYPIDASAFGVSPQEASIIYRDGRLLGAPDVDDINGFWSEVDLVESMDLLINFISLAARKLLDVEIVTSLYEFLIGKSDVLCKEFPGVSNPWLKRKPTPVRLLGLAAYRVAGGDISSAKDYLRQIGNVANWPPASIVWDDCERGYVSGLEERVAFLRKTNGKELKL